jgi:hypothetical protein
VALTSYSNKLFSPTWSPRTADSCYRRSVPPLLGCAVSFATALVLWDLAVQPKTTSPHILLLT